MTYDTVELLRYIFYISFKFIYFLESYATINAICLILLLLLISACKNIFILL